MDISELLSGISQIAQTRRVNARFVDTNCMEGIPPSSPVKTSDKVCFKKILGRISCLVEVRLNTKACSLMELAQIKPGETISYPLAAVRFDVTPVRDK